METRAFFNAVAMIFVLAASPANGQTAVGNRTGFPELKGPYLGQAPPGKQPTLFAPGIVSTDLHDDFSPAFTPAGDEVFFRCIGNSKMVILHMTQESGIWSHPEVAAFSGTYADLGVFLSHDGKRLFFSSNRPVDDSDTAGDFDIFALDRRDSGWGEPFGLIPARSWSGDSFGCSVDSAGTVFYYAKHPEGKGGHDLCRLVQTSSTSWQAEPLGIPVNTRGDETCPCIARDGSFLIYTAGKGPTASPGGCGLYVTFLQPDGSWAVSQSLSAFLGMKLPGKFAGMSPDSKYLFFVVPESRDANRRLGRLWEIDQFRSATPRYGGGNVYWVDASVLNELGAGGPRQN